MRIQGIGTRRLALLVAAAMLGFATVSAEEMEPGLSTLEPIVVGAPERIDVFPSEIKLQTNRRRMHLIVTGFYPGGLQQDLTRAAEFVSSDDTIVTVHSGVAHPMGNGNAAIIIRIGDHETRVPVEVSNFEALDPVSFQYETLVALSKHDCNSGACHGSPSGKAGFRLSLRAYDKALDTETLIREFYNRRTNVEQPEKSLLLTKPTMEVAHGGGRRLQKGDQSYQLLRNWIGEGLQVDPPESPECIKLEVYPPRGILKRPAHTQQLLVLAHFNDGSIRDVTNLVAFSSSDDAVASVDRNGLVVGNDRGEAAILARYLDRIETSHLMFLKDIPGFAWTDVPEGNYVDQHVFDKLEQLKISPSDLCSDDEFVRRVHLDVIGLLPTMEESASFVSDADPEKRGKLIDRLLERPEYAEFWALKWSDLLRLNNKKVTQEGVHKFRRWIVTSLRDNMPYDEFVASLLTSRGSTFNNPPANYYRTAADMNDCVETTSQLFLGIRIQCAKCHNHPFERWTQDNYYGIGAFFNRVQRKGSNNSAEKVIWVASAGEVTQPRTGMQMKPWLPLIGEAEIAAGADRRETFVAWLRQEDNPFFANAEVNRIWSQVMGRGIVEPVDDFRASNPPSNEALLDALGKDFISSGFDRIHITRIILNSRTYQLSARANDFNASDVKYFSHARPRLLTAEQLLDAICAVTGIEEKYAGLPAGTRATQLPSPDVDHHFLKVFGQPPREMACQCERSTDSNLSQALQMINGPLIHDKLQNENNRIRKLATAGKNDAEIVSELYQVALCRQPQAEEIEIAVNHIVAQEDRMQALEDVCWALLNAKEFLFQH